VEEAVKARKETHPDFELPERPIRVELGCPKGGGVEGFKTVDLYEYADYKGDARELTWLIGQTGMIDEIRASHLLEHLQMGEIPGVLKNWKRAMRPGGQIEVCIPDFDWGAEWALRQRDADPPDYWQQLMMIYGAQRNPGDVHRTPFNMTTLRKMMEVTGFVVVDSFYTQFLDARVQRSAIVVAQKPILNGDDEPAEGLRDLKEIKQYHQDFIEKMKAATANDDTIPRQPIISPFDPKDMVEKQLKEFFHENADSGRAEPGDGGGEDGDGESQDSATPQDGPGVVGVQPEPGPGTSASTSEGAACVVPG
jgi:predicted SAM-dependent methyltransferase